MGSYYDAIYKIETEHANDIKEKNNEIDELLKYKKVVKLIQGINFDITYREQFEEWTLYIVITTQDGEYSEPVAFGEGKDQYELLKEILIA